MTAQLVSRTYPTPVMAWASGIGLISVVGERVAFGHVAHKEVIISATGQPGVVDPRIIIEYQGDNVLGYRPRSRGVQMSLFPNDAGPSAA